MSRRTASRYSADPPTDAEAAPASASFPSHATTKRGGTCIPTRSNVIDRRSLAYARDDSKSQITGGTPSRGRVAPPRGQVSCKFNTSCEDRSARSSNSLVILRGISAQRISNAMGNSGSITVPPEPA
ncbi:outer membrane lipo Omp16 precursor, putative [Babesia ovata]|uniref:Outer membrane lipo Omp16, putative n=1 Tax=Babesia ovata TaxID=189622 RepID=A0A2H6KEY1_9APIC|nr:outer membrane lipo Omp16 precursor, putative [Babesia ovata]GBE61551.1 outer membrane lipo Omp16 precursor, putative [Babesia ovata]